MTLRFGFKSMFANPDDLAAIEDEFDSAGVESPTPFGLFSIRYWRLFVTVSSEDTSATPSAFNRLMSVLVPPKIQDEDIPDSYYDWVRANSIVAIGPALSAPALARGGDALRKHVTQVAAAKSHVHPTMTSVVAFMELIAISSQHLQQDGLPRLLSAISSYLSFVSIYFANLIYLRCQLNSPRRSARLITGFCLSAPTRSPLSGRRKT